MLFPGAFREAANGTFLFWFLFNLAFARFGGRSWTDGSARGEIIERIGRGLHVQTALYLEAREGGGLW